MSSVDVVVPCYNYAHYLQSCVDSVLSQRDVAVRVLIIDDASLDNTQAVAEQLTAADRRVSYIRNEVNLGLIRTANKGLMEWASAPYSLLLSADDALTPGSLARSTHVLENYPEVGLAYGMARIVGDDNDTGQLEDCLAPTYQIISGSRFLYRSCECGNPAASPSVIVRTSLQHRLGGYCAHLPHTSDMEMWMRFSTQASVAVIKDIQAYYRVHGTNMYLRYCNGTLADSQEQIAACREVFDSWCKDIPEFATWMTMQRRRLCDDAYWRAGVALAEGDREGVAGCLAFVEKYKSDARHSSARWRYRAKALLGQWLWSKLAGRIRRSRRVNSRNDLLQDEKVLGWWPRPLA